MVWWCVDVDCVKKIKALIEQHIFFAVMQLKRREGRFVI